MADIGLFLNATAGQQDGVAVSSGTGATPITATLQADGNPTASIPIAIRTLTAGNVSKSATTVALTGTTAAEWRLSLDNYTWAAYGASISIATGNVTDHNTLFYAQVKAETTENAQNDTSVSISVSYQVGPA